MPMDPNDNQTVGLPPSLANSLRNAVKPGAPEASPVAKAPVPAPAPATPQPERKPPPERPPAAPPTTPRKPPFGARPAPVAPVQKPSAARPQSQPDPFNTIPPPPSKLGSAQAAPFLSGLQESADESSWYSPQAKAPPTLPAQQPPAILEQPPRPVPARPPSMPVKPTSPVHDMPGTQTIAVTGKGIDPDLLAEGKAISIKVFTKGAAWINLVSLRIDSRGQVIGRNTHEAFGQACASLAPAHFRLSWTEGRLRIQEERTINGVYLRLTPHGLAPLPHGSRFMIGPHVLEFRKHEDTASANQPAVSPEGEAFRSAAVKPLGYLDVLGPNAKPSLRIPLTKPDFTDVGRYGGDKSDVVLSDDGLISRQHARIHHKDGEFFLEDLKSSNGTFLKVRGKQPLNLGSPQREDLSDQVLAGELYLRFIED